MVRSLDNYFLCDIFHRFYHLVSSFIFFTVDWKICHKITASNLVTNIVFYQIKIKTSRTLTSYMVSQSIPIFPVSGLYELLSVDFYYADYVYSKIVLLRFTSSSRNN